MRNALADIARFENRDGMVDNESRNVDNLQKLEKARK
jgi:hypothetical protein